MTRASCPAGACNSVANLVAGALRRPMSLLRSSSRDGRLASALMAAASRAWPDRPPPLTVSLLLRLAYSTAALAAATGSREKAIAVGPVRSEEHTSELQSRELISYAVF